MRNANGKMRNVKSELQNSNCKMLRLIMLEMAEIGYGRF